MSTSGGVTRVGRARLIRLDLLREALQVRCLGSLRTLLESLGVPIIACDGREWVLPAAFEKAIAHLSGVTLDELDSYEKAHGVLTTAAIRERLGLRVYKPHARPKRRKRLAPGPDTPAPDVPGQMKLPGSDTTVDGVAILHKRYVGNDPARLAALERERMNMKPGVPGQMRLDEKSA